MQLPTEAIPNPDRDTTRLFFKDSTVGEYYIRGGICWPVQYNRSTELVEGFAVLLAQNTKTRKVYAFEETPFTCIDHICAPDGRILHKGVAPWFSRCWRRYYCDTWYYNHDPHVHTRWRGLVSDSLMIEPDPSFMLVEYGEVAQAELVVLEYGQQGRFELFRNGPLHKAMVNHEAVMRQDRPRGERRPHPAILALLAGMYGIARYPWLDPDASRSSDGDLREEWSAPWMPERRTILE